MTFREAIQIQIKALQTIYDNTEGLRDIAEGDQKDSFNFLRGTLPAVWLKLRELDRNLSSTDAKYKCTGTYNVQVDTSNI